MLYSYDETFKIILRIYEYLQFRVKPQPKMIKLYLQAHRDALINFMIKLPPSAGADFVWEFMLFQFYIYSSQNQALRPLPVWFMGKAAWERWETYDEGAKWHVQKWAAERHFLNPVKPNKFVNVAEEVLRKERYRMSRISGPNFCGAKYGDEPYDASDVMCLQCPFKKDCELLYTKIEGEEENLFQSLKEIPITKSERVQLLGQQIKIRKRL